jgi:trk system potassium uptake protein TrkH
MVALWGTAAFLIALVTGFVVLRLPGAMVAGNELSFERALFSVMNSATLTGFSQTTALDRYGTSGQIAVVGLMVVGTLFALIVGGLAVVRVAGMRFSDREVIAGTLLWYVLSVFAGTALLADPLRPIAAAAVQAASAFGNCGIVLGTVPGTLDWRTHVVLMGLAALGAMGIPVLLDVSGAMFGKHRMMMHTRVVLGMMALLYLVGVAACVPWQTISVKSVSSWSSALASGSVLSMDARTAGMPVVAVTVLTRVGLWLLVGLMIVGGASGSCAGGIKVTTIYEVFRGVARALRGEVAGKLFGMAMVWVGSYTLIVAAAFLCLVALHSELPVDRLLFISVSAASLVGFSQDPISMTGGGMIVLSAAMFLGRVVPMGILWWGAMTVKSGDLAVG